MKKEFQIFKEEFQIFKEGRTAEKVTIFSKTGEPFDREGKIRQYQFLGYQVFDMNNKLINQKGGTQ